MHEETRKLFFTMCMEELLCFVHTYKIFYNFINVRTNDDYNVIIEIGKI